MCNVVGAYLTCDIFCAVHFTAPTFHHDSQIIVLQEGKMPEVSEEKELIISSRLFRKTEYRTGSGKLNWGEGMESRPISESKDGHPDFTLNPSPKKSITFSHIS
jgi:hypothetical protein